MSVNILKELLNKNKKPAKITGTIIRKLGYRSYVVKTLVGKMTCDSDSDNFIVSDSVVVTETTITGYSGKRDNPVELLV